MRQFSMRGTINIVRWAFHTKTCPNCVDIDKPAAPRLRQSSTPATNRTPPLWRAPVTAGIEPNCVATPISIMLMLRVMYVVIMKCTFPLLPAAEVIFPLQAPSWNAARSQHNAGDGRSRHFPAQRRWETLAHKIQCCATYIPYNRYKWYLLCAKYESNSASQPQNLAQGCSTSYCRERTSRRRRNVPLLFSQRHVGRLTLMPHELGRLCC